MRIASLPLVLAVATSVACGGSAPLKAQPTTPSLLAVSVSSRVLGLGFEGPYGAGVTLSVATFTPASASARLEIGFADDSTTISVPFSPATLSLGGAGSGTLSASVPDASDPRLLGRKPTSLRAALTVRDHAGTEKTIFLNLSVTQN